MTHNPARGHVTAGGAEFPAAELAKIVVCFLFDGSEKYNRMTLTAVNSFISTTPHVAVGLLFPQHYEPEGILTQIADRTRVSIRIYESHFQNWNPTQYKLDIRKFAPEFSTIFWLDSDALVYKDLSSLLHEFHSSPCKVAFLKDHVCFNPQFLQNWIGTNKADPFIPQACFMGFKADIVDEFFGLWENLWRTWIEPAPFANFPNPVPSFPGSAFCTEQYALGMALESGIVGRHQVYEIRRITFGLRGVGYNASQAGLAVVHSPAATSGSFDLESSFSLLSFGGSFSGGSFDTSAWSSGAFLTSWGTVPFFSAGNLSSFSGPTSFTGSFDTSFAGSFDTSFGGSSGSFLFENSSFSGVLASVGGSAPQGQIGLVPVDNIGGGIVHFYSAFYDHSSSWWQSNKTDVVPQLDQYWKSGSANFQ